MIAIFSDFLNDIWDHNLSQVAQSFRGEEGGGVKNKFLRRSVSCFAIITKFCFFFLISRAPLRPLNSWGLGQIVQFVLSCVALGLRWKWPRKPGKIMICYSKRSRDHNLVHRFLFVLCFSIWYFELNLCDIFQFLSGLQIMSLSCPFCLPPSLARSWNLKFTFRYFLCTSQVLIREAGLLFSSSQFKRNLHFCFNVVMIDK